MLDRLRAALPDLIPTQDLELRRMLRAAQRYPATDTRRSRPGKWKRKDLLGVTARLGDLLGRETVSHLSFASFVDHYLRLLDFPADVGGPLKRSDINLFEAEQLGLGPLRLHTPLLGAAQAARLRLPRGQARGRDRRRDRGAVEGERADSGHLEQDSAVQGANPGHQGQALRQRRRGGTGESLEGAPSRRPPSTRLASILHALKRWAGGSKPPRKLRDAYRAGGVCALTLRPRP